MRHRPKALLLQELWLIKSKNIFKGMVSFWAFGRKLNILYVALEINVKKGI